MRLLLGSPAAIGQMTVAQQGLLSRFARGGPTTRRSTSRRAKRRKGMAAFERKYGPLRKTSGYDDAQFLTRRRRKRRSGGRLKKGSAAAKRRMAALRRMRRR